MARREGVDLEGKRLIVLRSSDDEDADFTLARAIANGTGRMVVVLPPGQVIEALSDEELERLGLCRKVEVG